MSKKSSTFAADFDENRAAMVESVDTKDFSETIDRLQNKGKECSGRKA